MRRLLAADRVWVCAHCKITLCGVHPGLPNGLCGMQSSCVLATWYTQAGWVHVQGRLLLAYMPWGTLLCKLGHHAL